MKVEKHGNIYRKQSWLKEHRQELLIAGCVITGYGIFILAWILRG